jgi:hypothetical protein
MGRQPRHGETWQGLALVHASASLGRLAPHAQATRPRADAWPSQRRPLDTASITDPNVRARVCDQPAGTGVGARASQCDALLTGGCGPSGHQRRAAVRSHVSIEPHDSPCNDLQGRCQNPFATLHRDSVVTRGAAAGMGNLTLDCLNLSDGWLCHSSEEGVTNLNALELTTKSGGICGFLVSVWQPYPGITSRFSGRVSSRGTMGRRACNIKRSVKGPKLYHSMRWHVAVPPPHVTRAPE